MSQMLSVGYVEQTSFINLERNATEMFMNAALSCNLWLFSLWSFDLHRWWCCDDLTPLHLNVPSGPVCWWSDPVQQTASLVKQTAQVSTSTHTHHHHYPRCSLPLLHIWPCSEQHTAHKTTHHAMWSGHVTRMTCNTDWKVCCGIRHSVLYHRLTYAAWKAIHALGTPSAWPMSEALIESLQFIGWWRDTAPDALTSSAYTGEHAIYSSDFSAFTKRSYCPSVLRFFWPKYHNSDANYPFALRRLPTVELCSPCGEVPWSIAAVNRRARDSSLAMTHTVSV